ncbi:MAG TPA: DUF222 domain-containing protein, partial [Woeseiaceae bacterium]|nr:DUF222 domain-containing protein [Woeseiaceae bacterium]
MNWHCGIGMNAAREKVRVANALGALPQVSERYRNGEISYSKVRAISRIATPETEAYLLQIARFGSAAHVEGLVQKYRRCKRLQDQQESVRQCALRELSYFYDERGCLQLEATLPPEAGALVLKALELAMDRAAAEATHEREVAPSESDRAVKVIPAMAPRRADAMVRLAESYLAKEATGSSGADRYQVVVHVSAETLHSDPQPGRVSAETPTTRAGESRVSAETHNPFQADFPYLEDGPHVSAETARRLSCDASIIRVVDDDNGEPLNIGRKSRLIPPALRRALRMRDDGCRFPGCNHKYYLDGHHIRHWADGGETSLANLANLCRFHHRLIHEHGFGCERTADGRIRFTNPLGQEIGRTADLPGIPEDGDPREWLRKELGELDIDERTIVAKCRAGEAIDWDLAVSHLFDNRGDH